MAHPMIAQQCTELMAEAGVTRSDTARHFLNCLCRDEGSPCLLGFAKDMLTKRETKKEENQENLIKRKEGHRGPKRREENQERFSRLILDIQKMEDNVQSASVLKVASKIFVQNPFFPQALARFYSLELKDYNRAEMWAKRAKERDPKNPFIADTLGQVHKHHLNSKASSATPREILQLATRAIEAFKDEERLAENEQGSDMQEDGMTKVSNIFNNRGLFGYLQVANIVFESLVNCNKDWRKVFTKNVSLGSVLKSLGDNKLLNFTALINSFRDEVERKCAFFDTYLTYSKPGRKKDDPPYIWRDVSNCYQNYVGDSPPKQHKENIDKLFQCLKEKRAVTFPGLLSCLDRKYTVSQFKEITTWWGEIYSSKQCSDYAILNYILAKIMLHNIGEAFPDALIRRILIKKMPLSATEPPELHMLAALMFWPKDKESIQQMHCSYEHAYKKHFRSRYLRPLFFLGKGKGLSRIIHRSILDDIFCEGNEDTKQDLNKNWSKIFKHPRIQERLLKVNGVVRNCRVYATFGDSEIEVDANLRDSLWKSGQVSFYLGFTIRGPVAFFIQEKSSKSTEEDLLRLLRHLKVERHRTDWEKERDDMQQRPQAGPEHSKPHPHGPSRSCTSCGGVMDSSDWTEVEPKVTRVKGVLTYSLQSKAGCFECSVSGLRWVCQKNVSIKYQFTSWEEHMERLECLHYTPGGPLLDITVIAGKLDEVHLPHWICLDHNPTLSAKFAVLHIDTDGDVVEQVSEITSFHVKIFQPTFSPRGVLMKAGFPMKVHCNVLIYKTNTAPLTLHVYLVPRDPALQQVISIAMEQKEKSYGYKVIRKPNPDKSLQMKDRFILTTDADTAKICPDQLKLRYESNMPNFFEVFIKNAHTDFSLTLESAEQKKNKERHVVWTSTIRADEYQRNNGQRQDQHFVNRHQTALIDRVTNPAPILDRLKDQGFISKESYDVVRAEKTSQEQMRTMFKFLRSAGTTGKDALYEILKKQYKGLISVLEALD
ncbi:sterile alpha motif domain-containing protein 9-like isoform X1 [Centroberyx affinis]|uniref:sterile alpha motif domain-containing protein 9-like isoform X1 n=1 Tax=Centroberyx affinis TaxID=166261 RepID=UPI003A5BCAF7